MNEIKGYQVRDLRENKVVKQYLNKDYKFAFRTAHRRADKLDLQYGAIKYAVEAIY